MRNNAPAAPLFARMVMDLRRCAVTMDVVDLAELAQLANLAAEECVPVKLSVKAENVEMMVVDINHVDAVLQHKHAKMESVLELLLLSALEESAETTEPEEAVEHALQAKGAEMVLVSAIMIATKETVVLLFNLLEPTLASAHNPLVVLAQQDLLAVMLECAQLSSHVT